MSTKDKIEERKKARIKKTISFILENNPYTGISTRVANLLKGKLTKEKEFTIEGLIKDLKAEEKSEMIKNIQKNMKPAKMPQVQNDPRDDYAQFKKKGGSVKTYAKGGGVRKPNY